MLLIKFETRGEGVKGLCFHRKRQWILVSLDSGLIELWDYRIHTLIERFQGHDGTARSVHFHNTRPLFVSGGDDYKVKVWSYEPHQCLFTLLGHHNYIRTVQFHHEYPWILSASEDHTIRIWDWQSRTCISVLTDHKHCVTCASFHPEKDLVLSASLDHTALIWDISALRKETGLAVVKLVLNFFRSGVYWASFHPMRGYAVTADVSELGIYVMNDTSASKLHIWVGHENNVSCVLFPKQDNIMLSCSEDKSIRVWLWDSEMFKFVDTIVNEHDRFRILASHAEMNLLAAGHDSGMIVFKLGRERPAFSASGDYLFYVKGGRFLHMYNYSTQEDTKLITFRESNAYGYLNEGPRTLSYSPRGNAVLICSDMDGGCYQLFHIEAGDARGVIFRESKWGSGRSAVFVGENRLAVLMKSNRVLVKNLKNETVLKSPLPCATDEIIFAGSGNLLCRGEDRVYSFDLQQRIVLASLQTTFVRQFIWSCDMERIALVCRQSILLADKKLKHQCTLHDTVRIKSGAWDDSGEVFIYTTHTHIKYCLYNGDSGIIKSLGVTMYVTKVYGNTIFCLDRDGKNHPIVIDSTEYIFKLSLLRKRYDEVMTMIRNHSKQLCDNKAMFAYLQQKGYQEISLCSVDDHARFNLALESASKIDEHDHWYRLGVEALSHGNVRVAECAYQKTQNFERLSFLYLITGNLNGLFKMMKIAEVKNESMSQFHNALYLGDIGERVKVLESADHLPLAYITAGVHGLSDTTERLAKELGGHVPSMPKGKKASLLLPPIPILAGGDWPLLILAKGIFRQQDGLYELHSSARL